MGDLVWDWGAVSVEEIKETLNESQTSILTTSFLLSATMHSNIPVVEYLVSLEGIDLDGIGLVIHFQFYLVFNISDQSSQLF